MIIVSQDKDIIVNFDRVTSIWIDDNVLNKTNATFDIVADEGTIGTYKTEERAKEVLEEIMQKIEDVSWTNLMDNLQIAIHDKNFGGALSSVYRMPKE